MAFNPQDHITKLGNREYLEVKWRLVWFRDLHPQGRIETDFYMVGNLMIAKAVILDADGHMLSSGSSTVRAGTGKETWTGREIEKAETAAIGRGLAHAGFGTQFTDDDEGDNLADSPVERKKQAPAQKPAPQVVSKPASSGVWSKAEMTQFWSWWNGQEAFNQTEILGALNVERLSDWQGTIEQANTAMQTLKQKAG